MRPLPSLLVSASLALLLLAGCGYHTLGAATHLPPGVKTISIPVFSTRTDLNGAEQLMTEAVLREFTARTRLRVTPAASPGADAVLHGEILQEYKNYVFRQQYQSTADLPTFSQEDPAARQRLARDFARQLVADLLEGF
jgi:hypothetical protein